MCVCVFNTDDLSNKLNRLNAGCIIGSTLMNYLMYTENLVLMPPSSVGLSMFLSACSEYGLERDIKYKK